MALKERKDFYLKETEKVRDAVKKQNTQVKDYSLENLVEVYWDIDDTYIGNHLCQLKIDGQKTVVRARQIGDAVQMLVEEEDEYSVFPRRKYLIESFAHQSRRLEISTAEMNQEGLRDHIAAVTIGDRTALIDLDELLKAVRYS